MGVDIRDLNFSVNIGKFPFALMGWFLSYLHKCDLVHPLTIFCSLVKRFRSLGFSAQGSLFEPRPGHTFVEHYFPPLSIFLFENYFQSSSRYSEKQLENEAAEWKDWTRWTKLFGHHPHFSSER